MTAATTKKPYLTEESLGEALKVIFPGKTFIRNKQVPKSGSKCRPDFRCDELMLIVEFDGHLHYQKGSVQVRDMEKKVTYEIAGYKVVSIPYFVQLSSATIEYFFGVTMEWEQTYPHGFIDGACVLSGDFNSVGIRQFYGVSNKLIEGGLGDVAFDIEESLIDKLNGFLEKGMFVNDAMLLVAPMAIGSNARMLLPITDEELEEDEDFKFCMNLFGANAP